ncbi:MAG: hypothetical protein ACRELG_11375 [Gemmataceae bacterium]
MERIARQELVGYDSGSAIVSTTGEVLGLLYAGNGTQTYACPIQSVLATLNCTLA